MEIRELQYFLAVAEEGTISAAYGKKRAGDHKLRQKLIIRN